MAKRGSQRKVLSPPPPKHPMTPNFVEESSPVLASELEKYNRLKIAIMDADYRSMTSDTLRFVEGLRKIIES